MQKKITAQTVIEYVYMLFRKRRAIDEDIRREVNKLIVKCNAHLCSEGDKYLSDRLKEIETEEDYECWMKVLGANRGSASAPKAKQKRARRLFFVWYSRWESNPERPLRRGLLYPFNYGSVFVWSGRCTASDGSFRCPGGARRSCFYFTPFPWKRQPFFRDKFYNERGVPACRLCCVLQPSDKYSLYFV